MAEAVIEAFGTLKNVMNAPLRDIENVKVGARRMGPVASKRLKELLNA